MEITKRDLGQILLGVVMLLLGVSFLWFERSALLNHIPIFFRSWIVYPWQTITAGGLWSALGLFVMADAIWLRGGTFSARKTPVAIAAVIASATSGPLIYWFHIRFLFFSLAAYHVFDVPSTFNWLGWFAFFEWTARSIVFVWVACFILSVIELIRGKRFMLLAVFIGAPLAAAAIYFVAWQVFIEILVRNQSI